MQIRLNNSNSQIYNNLWNNPDLSGGGLDVLFTADVQNYGLQAWNNVAFLGTKSFFAYSASNTPYVASGPTAEVAYMDYNVYAGGVMPIYNFQDRNFNLAQWRAEGHEINATFPSGPLDVYTDLTSYVLKPAYQTAGRFGDPVGPRYPVASIMDATRYGPGAALSKIIYWPSMTRKG